MARQYQIDKLDTMLQHLAGVLHVSILILDADGNVLSRIYNPEDFCSSLQIAEKELQAKCAQCDKQIVERCKHSKKLERHICHAGLCDLALPIEQNNTIVAYVVLGRIKTAQSPTIPHYPHAHDLYSVVPFFTDEQLTHLCKLLPQIVLDCAIIVESDAFYDDIIPYIRTHLSAPLSVPALCKRYHVSKNTLYRFFKDKYNCSIGEFICNTRMEHAKELLSKTDTSVSVIADTIGIRNYTYFCKLFKQHIGTTPTTYRILHKKTDESI